MLEGSKQSAGTQPVGGLGCGLVIASGVGAVVGVVLGVGRGRDIILDAIFRKRLRFPEIYLKLLPGTLMITFFCEP